mmetsp:Transcript_6492/g.9114  ORF Transcript_6492/g.9114 Transcript_6492/m.9114 type:complete len:224 (-) Transcript_6492:244-915(-)
MQREQEQDTAGQALRLAHLLALYVKMLLLHLSVKSVVIFFVVTVQKRHTQKVRIVSMNKSFFEKIWMMRLPHTVVNATFVVVLKNVDYVALNFVIHVISLNILKPVTSETAPKRLLLVLILIIQQNVLFVDANQILVVKSAMKFIVLGWVSQDALPSTTPKETDAPIDLCHTTQWLIWSDDVERRKRLDVKKPKLLKQNAQGRQLHLSVHAKRLVGPRKNKMN